MATEIGAQSAPLPPPAPFDAGTGTVLRMTSQLAAAPAAAIPAATSSIPAGELTQIVLSIKVNGVAQGDHLAYMSADGDFLLLTRELPEMDIARAAGRIVDIGGEPHLSLKSIAGAEMKFDEKALTLELKLPPDILPSHKLDEGAKLPLTPVAKRAPGGFFNYSLGYSHVQDTPDSFNTTTETGINLGEFLLLDNHTFNTASGEPRSTRLQTQLIYDQPDDLRRWVIGDSFASSGLLGSSFDLGGISLSKLYQINPYFVKTPLAAFSGAVTLPSTVDIFMDGQRVVSQNVAPGNFNLQNLNSYTTTGLRNIDIVIRDAFGTEQHIGFPYFFTDQLLAKGLQEYSYNLGFIRENYGVKSDQYGTAALSAFHRYGVSDLLTIGAGIDATHEHVNFDPRVTFNTVKAGTIGVDISVSHDTNFVPTACPIGSTVVSTIGSTVGSTIGSTTGCTTGSTTGTTTSTPGSTTGSTVASPIAGTTQSGRAASLTHTYVVGSFSSQILVERYSQDYSVLGVTPLGQPKLQSSSSINYGTRDAGTYSLSYSVGTVYGGLDDQHTTTLSYTRTIVKNVSLVANVSRVLQGTAGYAVFIGLSYFSADGQTASASHQKDQLGNVTNQMQFAKPPPLGEGLGYRFVADRSVSTGTASESLSPFVQYNARDAIFIAQGSDFVNGGPTPSKFYQLTMAGAVAYIGGSAYLSRPITDSFGVVEVVPPLEGVRVLKGNAVIGSTDADGKVFIPILGSYQVNDVGIQPKDIPIDYSVALSAQKIRPPFRSGAIADFPVKRLRAITGKLRLRAKGGVSPLENVDFVLIGSTETVAVSAIRDGEFYLENLAPGHYTAQLKVGEKTCRLEVTMPDSAEIVTNLGDVFCEITD